MQADAEQSATEARAKTAQEAQQARHFATSMQQGAFRISSSENAERAAELMGVRSAYRDSSFRKAQPPKALPFDLPAHQTVFHGIGTYGRQPPLETPRGFKAETTR